MNILMTNDIIKLKILIITNNIALIALLIRIFT